MVRPPGPAPIVCSDLFPNRRGLCSLFLDSATSPFGFAQNDKDGFSNDRDFLLIEIEI